jgi:hypothetical protein
VKLEFFNTAKYAEVELDEDDSHYEIQLVSKVLEQIRGSNMPVESKYITIFSGPQFKQVPRIEPVTKRLCTRLHGLSSLAAQLSCSCAARHSADQVPCLLIPRVLSVTWPAVAPPCCGSCFEPRSLVTAMTQLLRMIWSRLFVDAVSSE